MNMRPELLRAAVLHAPFVDLVGAMADPTLPLTVHEYEEWGDPRDPQVWRCCPLRGKRAQCGRRCWSTCAPTAR